ICYILLATLVAPALVQMGADPLAAHLFIFYFGMISMITPPVAMASYAAATLAGSPFLETGFILPYIFSYNPALLFQGNLWEVGLAFASGVVGVIALGASMVGHMKRPLHMLERAFLFVGALLLIKPGYITDVIGLAIILSVYFLGLKQKPVQTVVIQEQKS
ncbi:MAG: TRAP transporter large permease subunit, partial [Acidobacteria bacterium]|nr:TRAP transporter large permease subunit [Acidobacteriota bacterium]